MRKSLFGVSMSLAIVACGQPPASVTADSTVPPTEQATASVAPRAAVEGWETDLTSFPLIGSTLPAFALFQANGTELTQENLRNRWTIIGFAVSTEALAKPENDYIAALNSAADQDPDLDFLAIRPAAVTPPPATPPAWPTLYDEKGYTTALGITAAPSYLLVGPDLTIEGYRGALSATPDDGIKSVIRGVAEIRKQVAAPE